MIEAKIQTADFNRPALIKKGRYLEYFTIGYNTLEGVIALAAGLVAGSIALVGSALIVLLKCLRDGSSLAVTLRCR